LHVDTLMFVGVPGPCILFSPLPSETMREGKGSSADTDLDEFAILVTESSAFVACIQEVSGQLSEREPESCTTCQTGTRIRCMSI
jgi:hypothetical protein